MKILINLYICMFIIIIFIISMTNKSVMNFLYVNKISVCLSGCIAPGVITGLGARPPCPIRSDHQTTGLTLTTGVWEACTKRRGASNMNIHYDLTALLTVVWRSHSGQIVWAAGAGQGGGGGGSELIAHNAISRSLPVADNWMDEDAPAQRPLSHHVP